MENIDVIFGRVFFQRRILLKMGMPELVLLMPSNQTNLGSSIAQEMFGSGAVIGFLLNSVTSVQ